MKYLITGATGFVGSVLTARLTSSRHRVIRLTRKAPPLGDDMAHWDPAKAELDRSALEGVEAVVNLAGEGISSRRWNDAHKARVLASRVQATTLLAEAIADLDRPPKVLISASGVHFYGDRGDEVLTESSEPGNGFMAGVVHEWENSTKAAEQAGVRVVRTRSGVIQGKSGGALPLQALLFKLGLGGKLGPGTQWLSWISIDDEIGAMLHLIAHDEISGSVNLTSPNPVTNQEFTRALGRVLGRPSIITAPEHALRIVLGEMADELVLASQRVLPARLQDSGYEFRDPEIEPALRRILT